MKTFLLKNKKIILSVFLSLFSVFGVLYYNNVLFFENSFNIIYLLIFGGLVWFYYKNNFNFSSRIKKFSIVISLLISFILIVGNKVYISIDKMSHIFNLNSILASIVSIIGFSTFFYILFGKMFANLNKIKIFSNEKQHLSVKKFLLLILIMFVCWIPYFIRLYPGIVTYDSYVVLDMVRFDIFDDHHAFGYVSTFGLIWKLGMFIFNNMIIATAFYTIIQIIFMSFTFSFLIKYLYDRGLNKKICILLFLIFALSPLHAHYVMTLWKDILFSAMFLLLTISIFELVRTNFKPQIRYIILFIVSSLGILFFRNNGIYVYLILLPFLFILTCNNKIVLRSIYISLIVVYFIIKGPIYNMIGVNPTSSVESFSIPLQQIARVLTIEKDLDKKTINNINEYIDVSNVKKSYTPELSDPIKHITNSDKLKNNKIDFLKIWLNLLIKYPGDYVDAYLSQTLGYWYPNVPSTGIGGIYRKSKETKDVYNTYTRVDIFTKIIDYSYSTKIPLSIIIWSAGLQFIILLLATSFVLYLKKYKLLLVYIPAWALWLSIMVATPVFCELRYVYGLFVTVPFLAVISFYKFNKDSKNQKKKIKNHLLKFNEK